MLHDTTSGDKGLIQTFSSDSLIPGTKRVNQNANILTINPTVSTASFIGVPNGNTVIIEATFTNVQNTSPIIAFYEWVIYLTDTSTSANVIFPYHSSSTVDLSNWRISGPASCRTLADNTIVADNKDVQRVTLRNISAGTVDLIVFLRPKYIFNRG